MDAVLALILLDPIKLFLCIITTLQYINLQKIKISFPNSAAKSRARSANHVSIHFPKYLIRTKYFCCKEHLRIFYSLPDLHDHRYPSQDEYVHCDEFVPEYYDQ